VRSGLHNVCGQTCGTILGEPRSCGNPESSKSSSDWRQSRLVRISLEFSSTSYSLSALSIRQCAVGIFEWRLRIESLHIRDPVLAKR
jgi:hypothetical protein